MHELLHVRIAALPAASGDSRPLEADLREQIDTLALLDDEFGSGATPMAAVW